MKNYVLTATEGRFNKREKERQHIEKCVRGGRIVEANEPGTMEKWLRRKGVPESARKAIMAQVPVGSVVHADGLAEEGSVSEPLSVGLERLLGENNFMGVSFLKRGGTASRSVGRVNIRRGRGFGTGFLVSPRLLLTNNHVLETESEASDSTVEFDFEVGVDRDFLSPVIFELLPNLLFLTDRDLDYTLVAVAEESTNNKSLSDYGFLPLADDEGSTVNGDRVNIIQHPNGERKQVAIRDNQVIDMLDDFLHYKADTSPGSSGSPVFNDFWEVVALHHSGVPRRNANGDILAVDGSLWRRSMGDHRVSWIANEGVLLSSILDHIRRTDVSREATSLKDEFLDQSGRLAIVNDDNPPLTSIRVSTAQSVQSTATVTIPLKIEIGVGPNVNAVASTEESAEEELAMKDNPFIHHG